MVETWQETSLADRVCALAHYMPDAYKSAIEYILLGRHGAFRGYNAHNTLLPTRLSLTQLSKLPFVHDTVLVTSRSSHATDSSLFS